MIATRPTLVVDQPRIVIDPRWGYARIDPVPSSRTLDRFYESRYADLLLRGFRAPDLARLMQRGPDADLEREWQARTIHADILDAIERAAEEGAPRTVLDVGSGTGEAVRALAAAGWDATGTEPAVEMAEVGRRAGLHIEAATGRTYLRTWAAEGRPRFGAILLLNVLEHVPHPERLVAAARASLAPNGRLVVRVPNDFNPLQLAARRVLGGDPWWVVVPDHVNYFDHGSIRSFVELHGFEVVDHGADYPMELFLLEGLDYRDDPEAGRAAHHRRRQIELALDPELRRSIGRGWASAGVGRNAFLSARPRG